jgi:phage terminase small subunit
VTHDRVIQELARIAFLDVRRMFDSHGRLLPLTNLANDVASAVTHITMDPSGTVRIRLGDKIQALGLLARHLGMFKEPRQTAPTSFNIDATQIARMTVEELDAGIANVDKLIAAIQGQAEG